jgi:hypothetical protein
MVSQPLPRQEARMITVSTLESSNVIVATVCLLILHLVVLIPSLVHILFILQVTIPTPPSLETVMTEQRDLQDPGVGVDAPIFDLHKFT